MTNGEIEWARLSSARRQSLVNSAYEAALFMIFHLEHHGWKKWSDNYLREHVRCVKGETFKNDISPYWYKELRRQHPELTKWFENNGNATLI